MSELPGRSRRASAALGRLGGRGTRWLGARVVTVLGGAERTRVIAVLACVLGLSGADAATVGASATQLRQALGIGNTQVGLLVTVTAVVGAVASLPFGVLADRVRRTWLLGGAVATWAVAMVLGALAQSFHDLLTARLFLGAVTAVAGPTVASLLGDYFPGAERGRIFGYVLTGELVGAGIGFTVTGDLAAVSWRAAFGLLAVPALVLAWLVLGLPEPGRGGTTPLTPAGRSGPVGEDHTGSRPRSTSGAQTPPETPAQRLARKRGVLPDPDRVLTRDPARLSLPRTVRYVLGVPTNIALIAAGAAGYFFLAGVQTFGLEFAKAQLGINQFEANGVLLVIGLAAVLGVLCGGALGDLLLHRFLTARILTAGIAASAAVVVFVPGLLIRSVGSALPFLCAAGFFLSAQNPPLDAARLDIIPAALWGRAEAIRTLLRTLAQALAPLLFGALADHVFGGGRSGLQATFLVMLVPLAASAVLVFRAGRTYPSDVATAAAASHVVASPRVAPRGRENPPPGGSVRRRDEQERG